jgi:hypothetical protein
MYYILFDMLRHLISYFNSFSSNDLFVLGNKDKIFAIDPDITERIRKSILAIHTKNDGEWEILASSFVWDFDSKNVSILTNYHT